MGISEFLDLMYLFNQDLSFESDSSSCVLTYKRSGLPSISRLPLIIIHVNSGVCSFCRNFVKLCGAPGFWENVLDSFLAFALKFPIQTLLSAVPTHSVFWYATQFQQNEHTPEISSKICIECIKFTSVASVQCLVQ